MCLKQQLPSHSNNPQKSANTMNHWQKMYRAFNLVWWGTMFYSRKMETWLRLENAELEIWRPSLTSLHKKSFKIYTLSIIVLDDDSDRLLQPTNGPEFSGVFTIMGWTNHIQRIQEEASIEIITTSSVLSESANFYDSSQHPG
ncbi:unnamed protein product [Absidia cylindrospora]